MDEARSPHPRSAVTDRLEPILLLMVLTIAAALRFYCLTCSSLWHDEGNTWALVGRSFIQIARDSAADIHPPGYYWLLKLWTTLFGTDVGGLRSFSAVAGAALVLVLYQIGRQLAARIERSNGRFPRYLPLLAAFIAAINPFQIYYSQEARMYALLALESALLFWALIGLIAAERRKAQSPIAAHPGARLTRQVASTVWLYLLCYFLAAVAGLWTHYSFPIVLAAAGLAYLWYWWRLSRSPASLLLRFLLLNALVCLFFLPWLPTAIDRVLNWPAGGETVSLLDGLALTLQTLAVGPIRTAPSLSWGWLLLAGLLPLLGLFALRHTVAAMVLGLWLLAPLGLMFGLGLYSEAFLKFLLIASPTWCLLLAAAPQVFPIVEKDFAWKSGKSRQRHTETKKLWPRAWRHQPLFASLLAAFLVLAGSGLAITTLPAYYANPAARDNYAGIARYVAALGDASMDLVVLDAPGQQEVWAFYDSGLPVLALPQQRPADPAQTQRVLTEAAVDRRQIFALFWALDEADPQQIVETWLDQHAFKGLESWQGNVRFAVYSLPHRLHCADLEPIVFGEVAALQEICQPAMAESGPQTVAAGETVLVGLGWRALSTLDRRYKVSVQLLDSRDQVIAQQDSEPAGGSRPTLAWQAGDIIQDNHGVTVPPGTPPGDYRLIVALYDAETRQRLSLDTEQAFADAAALGNVRVVRPEQPLPPAVVPIQQRLGLAMGPVTLVGYAAHRKGFAHAPETVLAPGDLLHVTLYWQAPSVLPADWPSDLHFTLTLGERSRSLTAPLAGGAYPTGSWQGGEFVRGEFDIPFEGTGGQLWLQVAGQRVHLGDIPVAE